MELPPKIDEGARHGGTWYHGITDLQRCYLVVHMNMFND